LRGAWIEAQRGNLARAIEQTKEALAQHPDYFWGWQLLADWYAQNQQLEEASAAAQKMADLAPLEAVPLGLLGSLRLKLGDAKAASAAFERAFRLDPDYEYAGYELFRLQLVDGNTAAAEQTLKVLGRRGENHKTLSAGVELAAVSRDWPRAFEIFQRICERKDVEAWSLTLAVECLDKHGWGRKAGKILRRQVSGQECQLGLAECWVQREINRGHWNLHKQLLKLLQVQADAGRRAILCYLDSLGRALQTALQRRDVTTPLQLRYHFWRLMRQHRSWLNCDVDGWGKVGFVLTCIGRPRAVVSWLGDWKERPKAESWMLYNLVLMLQRQDRYAESLDIIRHAVTLRHDEQLYEIFRVSAAFEEALLGNMGEATKHLASLPTNSMAPTSSPCRR
jgi:tetratricopeptide (TPR) repeat protein